MSLLNSCKNNIDVAQKNKVLSNVRNLIDSSKKYDQIWHYDSSIKFATTAIGQITETKSPVFDSVLAYLLNIRGRDYRRMSEFKKAWDDYQESLYLTENRPELKSIRFQSNFGLSVLFYYYKQNNNTDALKYIDEAAKNALNKHDSVLVKYFKCEYYLQMGNVDSATKYFRDMTEQVCYSFEKPDSNKLTDPEMVPWIWESKAKIGALNKLFSDTVLSDINKSIELNQGIKDPTLKDEYQLCAVYYTKAEYLFQHNKHKDTAFKCLESANKIARRIKFIDIDMKSSKLLYEFYSNNGDTGKALEYKEKGDLLSTLQNSNNVIFAAQKLEENKKLEERSKLQRNWLQIGGSIIIIFLIITILIFYRKKRKLRLEYNEAMDKLKGQNDWNDIYEEFIIQKENVLKPKGNYDFTRIVSLIKNHFIFRFGGIVVFNNKEIILGGDKNNPVTQKIIGDFQSITKNDFIFREISNHNIELKEITKKLHSSSSLFIKTVRRNIIKSNQKFDLIVIGLFSDTEQNELIGYLFFVNPVKNVSDLKQLEILGKQVSDLVNSNTHYRENEKKESDRVFINELVDSKDDFEYLLKCISDYLIKEFNLISVSFRVPVINGIEREVISNDKLLFPLRRFDLSDQFKEVAGSEAKKIEDYFKITRKVLKLSELSYSNDVKENFASGIIYRQCLDNIDGLNKPIKDILRKSVKIIVPIHKSNRVDDTLYEENKWKDLYGVFNLRAYNSENWDSTKARLDYLASHITHVINGDINSKKYDQIRILKEEIDALKFESDIFYNQIALLVAKVLNAEICSIFMVDKNEEKLTLKATTAEYAIFNDQRIHIKQYLEENKNFDSFFYLLTEKDRHTVSVILENKPRLDYTTGAIGTSKKYREQTSSAKGDNYSVLFVPLKDKEHKKAVGVIKCLGKQESRDNLSNTFWNFDKETLELIAVLAERFIENAEFDKEKDIFIKQVAHETLSPLQQLLGQSENLSSTLKRDSYVLPKDFDKLFNSITDNIELFKNIILDIEDVSINETNKLSLSTKNEDVKKIIIDIVKMFDNVAFRAGKKIIPHVNDLPPLKVDKTKIKQVIINLLTNAINYSDNNTKIDIYYKECQEVFLGSKEKWWHEIEFVNQGIGIAKDFEENNLFKLYKRSNNAIAKRPSGRGIGLFLVKKIMEAHGGQCVIRKRYDPTKISILFPKH